MLSYHRSTAAPSRYELLPLHGRRYVIRTAVVLCGRPPCMSTYDLLSFLVKFSFLRSSQFYGDVSTPSLVELFSSTEMCLQLPSWDSFISYVLAGR